MVKEIRDEGEGEGTRERRRATVPEGQKAVSGQGGQGWGNTGKWQFIKVKWKPLC